MSDDSLINEAIKAASGKEYVYIVAGLRSVSESEGFDRVDMKMPASHVELIEAVAAVNKNVVVFLLGGSPMEIVWQNNVKGILMCYLGGETVGKAIAELIIGKKAPGGRLSESWPYRAEDNPSTSYFPGYEKTVEYREGIFVGYRYYDTAGKRVRFPFGFGLSYTTFEYGVLQASKSRLDDTDTLTLTLYIKNTGNVAGSEVVQLYVAHKNPTIFKAAHELKGFEKVYLSPGESKSVCFTLDKRSFAYYNTELGDWHVETGEYELRVGASSRDIRGSVTVSVSSTAEVAVPDYRVSAPAYYDLSNGLNNVSDEEFAAVLGRPLPQRNRNKNEPFDQNSTLGDIREKWIGRVFAKRVEQEAIKTLSTMSDDIITMFERMFNEMPLRSIRMMAGDKMPPQLVEGLVAVLNGHPIKGLLLMGKK